MKYKVKGLVFVGFAAAILSANAMAANNTVTSKSYVDQKFQVLSGIQSTITSANEDSETLYPSMKALTDGLNAVEHQNTVTGTNYVTSSVDPTGTTVGLDSNRMTTTYTAGTPLSTSSTNLVTESVVASAIADASQVTNFIEDSVTDGITNKAPTENAVYDYVTVKGVQVNGTALTPDTSKNVNVTVASGSTAGTIAVNGADVAVNSVEVTTHKLEQGTASGSVITDQATDEQYPSALAVYNAIAAASDVDNFIEDAIRDDVTYMAPSENAVYDALGNKQDKDTTNVYKVGQNGAWANVSAAVADTGTHITTTNEDDGSVTINVSDTTNVAAGITASSTSLTEGKAVYDYVQSITNGNTIPAMPSSCDATHPCVLTNDTTDGHLDWFPIQQ